jgi:hypothetical protein
MCTKRAAVSTTGNLWAKEVPEEWQMQEKYTWGLLEYQSRGDRLVFIVKKRLHAFISTPTTLHNPPRFAH